MINEKEIESVTLSPTAKDFYQIWNELLETAGKISERWDPSSTNESDPGVVLLKVLAALGDKLNYNIDKNILEAFMPSATQQESMRKLCDMLGYSMKYYQSATTDVTIQYTGDVWEVDSSSATNYVYIPEYTTITDTDATVSYITLKPIEFTYDTSTNEKFNTDSVECIEGQLCTCETDSSTNKLVTMAQLDDNFRYYLPETQIAENGIFIFNATINNEEIVLSESWEKVNNLNIQPLNKACYKIGFDSKKGLLYVQFPKDISSLIGDGLRINYIRTNGINGNISARTLTKLTKPSSWSTTTEVSIDNFTVVNPNAATNGADLEDLNSAYNNYKKTIGTFDTLVTCRDYMNKIYQLTESEFDTTPLVSNIVVADIRDDINRAYSLCEFDDFGIKYVDKVVQTTNNNADRINHFNLVLYPFKAITPNTNTESDYLNSFKYSLANKSKIENDLEKYKTISHSYIYPDNNTSEDIIDIVCIKNYLKLNAIITTTSKVNTIEESSILGNIYKNIYNKFNARKLDFGEAIPFDSIYSAIVEADARIKNVSLEEPILYTTFIDSNNKEYNLASGTTEDIKIAKKLYNKLALRNILAGKIALFNYNTDFKYTYTEKKYPSWTEGQTSKEYKPLYPVPSTKSEEEYSLIKLESNCIIDVTNLSENEADNVLLGPNEAIQFRAPSLKTEKTYSAYINYYLHLKDTTASSAIPAEFTTLNQYMLTESANGDQWDNLFNNGNSQYASFKKTKTISGQADFNDSINKYGAIWKENSGNYTRIKTYSSTISTVIFVPVDTNTFPLIYNYIEAQLSTGIYRSLGWDSTRVPGYLIDVNKVKYHICTTYSSFDYPLNNYFIAINLGQDVELTKITSGESYELKTGEYLLINYTEASDTSDSTTESVIKNIEYESGTIICPNFDLEDSNKRHTDGKISWDKTSGFSFEHHSDIAGMFALGTSQQIEIKNKTVLNLGFDTKNETYSNVFIYWDLLNEDKLSFRDNNDGTITLYFPLDSQGEYILQEGEYFYFTDANKLDMSYYGNGTKITVTGGLDINKTVEKDSTASTADEIFAAGINGINWWKISPNANQKLMFQEYQYISLIEGDTLQEIELNQNNSELNNNWVTCTAATYSLAGETKPTSLPKLDISGYKWEVRSLLQFNISPNTAQILRTEGRVTDKITMYKYKNDSTAEIEPIDTLQAHIPAGKDIYVSVALKSNYSCISSNDTADVRIATENVITGEKEWINDFKLRVFDNESLKKSGTSGEIAILETSSFGNHWTKIFMSNLKKITATETISLTTDISVILPNDQTYGLVMIHLIAGSEEQEDQPYLTWTSAESESKESGLKIFNYYSSAGKETWWDGLTKEIGEETKKETGYILKAGLNVIKVEESSTITIHPDSDYKAIIILGDLDIINKADSTKTDANGINIAVIKYNAPNITETEKETAAAKAKQLLADINALDKDHEFYYNCPIENSEALDINTALDINNEPIETLADANTWYNYNNVNNKFVISEIDNTYMKTKGINIAKSSKRTY